METMTTHRMTLNFAFDIDHTHPIGMLAAAMDDAALSGFIRHTIGMILDDLNKGGSWAILSIEDDK